MNLETESDHISFSRSIQKQNDNKSHMIIDTIIIIIRIAVVIFQILLLLITRCSGLQQDQQQPSMQLLPFTKAFTSASGLPVCRYALGGAARSNQPQSIVARYDEYLQQVATTKMAPFLFYYNPHRYPPFINGIRELCAGSTKRQRQDLFIASGGSDRSDAAMDQRLDDALAICGCDYLDMFVIEYVEPHEMMNDVSIMPKVLKKTASWVKQGHVRYVAASTHSHVVGKQLLLMTTTSSSGIGTSTPDMQLDAIMLRYNMAHRKAAQTISFPAAVQAKKPVLAFTTTRWNALQKGHKDWNSSSSVNDNDDGLPPSTGDCLSFALAAAASPPVEIVLHSARDETELLEALCGFRQDMSTKDIEKWSRYGDLNWNQLDGFDEYPEEEQLIV